MNAQRQDALRILAARGPMTSRELFDVMQDELGYWSQASSNDQQSIAVEALSKILSKMKSENLIYGTMTAQPKGRPVMVWSAPISNQQIDTTLISSQYDNPDDDAENDFGMMSETPAMPDDEHAEMSSDIAELNDDDAAIAYMREYSEVIGMRIIDNSKRIETSNGIEIMVMNAHASSDGCYLRGETVIRNKAQLAQIIGAIERMLP